MLYGFMTGILPIKCQLNVHGGYIFLSISQVLFVIMFSVMRRKDKMIKSYANRNVHLIPRDDKLVGHVLAFRNVHFLHVQ